MEPKSLKATTMPRSNREPKPAKSARLTERQEAVLDFIADFIDQFYIPPTVREICEEFGIRSTNGVIYHLRALERKGRIGRYEGVSRGIFLL